jgi:hypothetical protein
MPFSPAPLGFAYFAAVKFVGYSAYAALLNSSVSKEPSKVPSAWKSGLVRTGIGVAVGTVVGLTFWKLLPSGGWLNRHGDALFWWGLVPVRVLEWYFFLWLLYRQYHLRLSQTAFAITSGIVVSFLLDGVGVFAMLVVPGGAWVC